MPLHTDPPYYPPYVHETPAPTMAMTTDQIERLAKAGVTVELAHKVYVQDPPPPMPPPQACGNDISQGIRERWMQSAKQQSREFGSYIVTPELCAFQHGDKVYVFAYSGNAEPEIIVDEAAIYPSDALLARLHLMMQHAK